LPVIKGQADRLTVERAFHIKGGYIIPIIAFGLCLWMISHSSADSWTLVGGLLVAGLVLYWLEQFRIRKRHAG
jgi:hypothetical protein